VARALEDLGLLVLDPQRLGQAELGRDVAVAVVLQRRVAGLGDAGGLAVGADVHPHDRRAQVPAVLVEGDDRRGGRVGRDAGDLLGRDPALVHHPAHRAHERGPPLVRVLLGPPRPRVIGLELDGVEPGRVALGVEDAGAHAARPEVDAHHVAVVSHGLSRVLPA
jgi:hypothetical protein